MRLAILFLVLFVCAVPVLAAVPATPTTYPIIHLLPNGAVGVGGFWADISTTTGRTETSYTWGYRRCNPGPCTPSTSIASGLTSPDFQNTGLSANTNYCFAYYRTNGDGNSGDSPAMCVTTKTSDDGIASVPINLADGSLTSFWRDFLEPLPAKATIPFPTYFSWAESAGTAVIAKIPTVFPYLLQGTGAINNGSKIVTGTSTFFREQAFPNTEVPSQYGHLLIGGVDLGLIDTVDSNTQITMITTYTGSNLSGQTLNTNGVGGNDYYGMLMGAGVMYYDGPLSLLQIYLMGGDPVYLRGWWKATDGEFAGHMHLGRDRDIEGHRNAPRTAALEGMVFRALSGRPEMWDWIDLWESDAYQIWIIAQRSGFTDQIVSPRDQSYVLKIATMLNRALPDSFSRSDGTTTSANGTITVDGDATDGRKKHYKDQLDIDITNMFEVAQLPHGAWYQQGAGGQASAEDTATRGPSGTATGAGISQPFTAGLLADAMMFVYRNTNLSTATRNSAMRMVLRYANYIYLEAFNKNQIANDTGNRYRYVWYFAGGGGTNLQPFLGRYGSNTDIINSPDSTGYAAGRQTNNEAMMAVGNAWELTGDTFYRDAARDMLNAGFAEIDENTWVTGDGYKCAAFVAGKEFGQGYRGTGRTFGQALTSYSAVGSAPSITMPANLTLTGGVNQAPLTAVIDSCPDSPCVYRWTLENYPGVYSGETAMPTWLTDTSLSTLLCGLEPGIYKTRFYATNTKGRIGTGTSTVTVGDGVFPPIGFIGENGTGYRYTTTTSSTVTVIGRAYSLAGRSLTHNFSIASDPSDKATPGLSTSSTTGNSFSFNVTGVTSGFFTVKNHTVDSAGATRDTYHRIMFRDTPNNPPSLGHNTPPIAVKQPNHVLYPGQTSTKLQVVLIDAEGWNLFANTATGYESDVQGMELFIVKPLTHVWTQTSGTAATLAGTNTPELSISSLSVGTAQFTYTGTDGQGDTAVVVYDVVTSASGIAVPSIKGGIYSRGRLVIKH